MNPLPKSISALPAVWIACAVALWCTQPAAAEVQCDAVPSAILGHSVSVCVSLPPSYASTQKRFPTLYFLHGLFENECSWSERGGAQILDGLWAQGDAGEFIVVLPDGGKTFYINSFDGHERYEDFFISELVPWVDRKFRTLPSPAARGISGTSMGGFGALHIGMEHPDVFGSVSAHSAALIPKIPNPLPSDGRWGFYAKVLQAPFGSPLNSEYFDRNNPLTLAEEPGRFREIKLYFDCGESDRYGFEAGAQALHEKLRAAGFPHEFALRPGDHGWSYLNQYLKYSIHFHWQCFSQGGKPAAAAAGGSR
jgi:S-formylglutathione hydrolase FrmB